MDGHFSRPELSNMPFKPLVLSVVLSNVVEHKIIRGLLAIPVTVSVHTNCDFDVVNKIQGLPVKGCYFLNNFRV